jgi:hypothetical protein
LAIAGVVTGLLLALAPKLFPCLGACVDPTPIRSIYGGPNYSYVYSPFVCTGYPCPGIASVSGELGGAFWAIGYGDPTVGAGHDNSGFPALDGWVRTSPYGLSYLEGGWDSTLGDARIDGCIDDVIPAGTGCTAILLSDLDASCSPLATECGYFAALTAEALSPTAGYDFGQAGNAPILLASTPEVRHPYGEQDQEWLPYWTVQFPSLTGGLYPDPACEEIVSGFRLYQYRTASLALEYPAGFAPGIDWQPSHVIDWIGPVPPGQTATVQFDCDTPANVWLGYTLVFDSGFELPWITVIRGLYVPAITCCTDQDRDGHCPDTVFESLHDCDDTNADVYQWAPQICDGVNNQCNDPAWPSLAGTNEADDDGDGLSECAGDCDDGEMLVFGVPGEIGATLAWTAADRLVWQSIDQARTYNVYRSDFGMSKQGQSAPDCYATDLLASELFDSSSPVSGGHSFLVSAENSCGEGPLGNGSQGRPRLPGLVCP